MYKLVLCLRYLRTRWIALASIISVTLGVATMIVVNSVMAGFTHEMRDRIHGILSDVVLDARSIDGAPDYEKHRDLVQSTVGDLIQGMSPTVNTIAMLGYKVNGQPVNRQVMLIGIDAETYGQVSDFGQYLQHPINRGGLRFDLHEGGYDTVDHQAEDPASAARRPAMQRAGWGHRRNKALWEKRETILAGAGVARDQSPAASEEVSADPKPETPVPADPFAAAAAKSGDVGTTFDPAIETHPGAVLGMALGSFRERSGDPTAVPEDQFLLLPGDDVTISLPANAVTGGGEVRVSSGFFTVVDFYESKMSEYDSQFVFVPIERLQELRGMQATSEDAARFNSIQIQCKPGVDPSEVRNRLQKVFAPGAYVVSTWMDKQGALLAAVEMETAVLNVLLFLIIAVAGFGILATFYMIVAEKKKDIGILKSMGASNWQIYRIFVQYGGLLGSLGAGIGVMGGLAFVAHINEIADFLARLTGRPVFDPSIYYFSKIPAIVHEEMVVGVAMAAAMIAAFASILPAIRAAFVDPVRSLR